MAAQLDFETANADAIAALANEIHHPLSVVKRAYETEFARLQAGARVTDFLVLLASRGAREALRRQSA